ncbi:MAG: LysR family transcriptional regulator [Pseudomonadota bacterium]
MTLSLRAMRYVQAALRQGSISAAADVMNVAPSAVATALEQAETAFGMTLATRARAKGIFPTAAGREVLRRVDDLLERYETLLTDMSDLRTGVSGNLAIGYNAPIAPAFLPAITKRLLEEHPAVTLSFAEGDNTSIRTGLIEGHFDVILFVEEAPSPQISTLPLIFAPTYCLCPIDHPLSQHPSVTVEQIAPEALILLDRPAARSYYMDLMTRGGAPFRIAATANSTEMVRSLVAEGLGVSLLNMRPKDIPTYAGKHVRCLPISGINNGVQLSLGFPTGPKRQLAQIFIETCVAFFEGSSGEDFTIAMEDPGHPRPD